MEYEIYSNDENKITDNPELDEILRGFENFKNKTSTTYAYGKICEVRNVPVFLPIREGSTPSISAIIK